MESEAIIELLVVVRLCLYCSNASLDPNGSVPIARNMSKKSLYYHVHSSDSDVPFRYHDSDMAMSKPWFTTLLLDLLLPDMRFTAPLSSYVKWLYQNLILSG